MVTQTRASMVSAAFVKLTDTLVGEYDVLDVLHTLVEECVELLDASAAGLLLADPSGELQVVASTSEESYLVEVLQQQAGAGPCVDCYLTGKVVTMGDIAASGDTYPVFKAAALSQGFRSVHAIPMRVRNRAIGALNLFRTETGDVTPEDAAIGQAMADVATISILQERTVREDAVVNEQLQRALNSRIVIEQAKGVIAQLSTVDMDEAFKRLRADARARNHTMRESAENVINRRIRL
ncbi:ANTAR domain-containing protein [Cryobacterium sp. TMS1-20-1]|nr:MULTISPECIES: GAF and ANTAR domain-containing protein [unclassified Cryobacterium]TFC79127.1 ANTAR domain-containing protein [Cryobacterium sp. TMS1-20-1]TFD52468.1 ANTAR domain-containing protein [Cryobacterium sp. Hh11]TFD58430.1 ANTAR domain-containing protein [Cryobacterium sp. Hh7]TFD63949.1 ANTAR domain-containing protein [Cryobacterium sp. Hh38]